MPLESAEHINDLDIASPAGGETPTQGDDHMRLIKSVLVNDLGSLDGALTVTAEQLNALPDGVAACVLKAGDTMTGNLLMSGAASVDFALDDESDVNARIIRNGTDVQMLNLDAEGAILASLSLSGAGVSVNGELNVTGDADLQGITTAVTPADDAGDTEVVTVGYLNSQQRGILHVREHQAQGTDGGNFASGAPVTRDLNTEIFNGITGASLASGQVTLPAGTYWVDGNAIAYRVNAHRLTVYDVTNAGVLLGGSSNKADIDNSSNTDLAVVRGLITLAAETVIELQHECGTSNTNGDGLGNSTNLGVEVYADLMVQKL